MTLEESRKMLEAQAYTTRALLTTVYVENGNFTDFLATLRKEICASAYSFKRNPDLAQKFITKLKGIEDNYCKGASFSAIGVTISRIKTLLQIISSLPTVPALSYDNLLNSII